MFCSDHIKEGVFTFTEKDNIDHKASSSTVVKHYHGTAVSIVQLFTYDTLGEEQQLPLLLLLAAETDLHRLKIPETYTLILLFPLLIYWI